MMTQREGFDRELGPGGLEARGYVTNTYADGDTSPSGSPYILGIGSPYGQSARIAGWMEDWDEVVAPGAWQRTISRDGADIVSTFNHDVSWLLGRTTAGTLRLESGDSGLTYRVEINPDDGNAMSVRAKVSRGDVTGSSVWFRVLSDQWDEPTDDNGLEVPLRTILEAELFEVGPVVFPAFPQTTATARAAGFRDLGYNPASLAALDGSLRAAGITKDCRRAARASRFLADPSSVAEEIRALFARTPDLRDAVCETTPPATDTPEPSRSVSVALDPQRINLERARRRLLVG
jgi:HK97 family phage prohead protease